MAESVPQALCISEILAEIFCLLPKRADAVSAALACRTWTGVALNRVWQDLPSVFPLLELLGPLIYVDSRGWDFERGIPDADFSRLAAYTSRVRSVRYNDQERWTAGFRQRISTDVAAKVLYYIASHQGQCLLPAVKSVEWIVSKDEAVNQILPFLSGTLVTLDIRLGCEVTGRATLDLLRTLSGALTKDLKRFVFYPSMENEAIDDELTSALNLFHSLTRLQAPYSALSADTLVRLGPTLRSLEIQYLLEVVDEFEDLSELLAETCPVIETLIFYVAWASRDWDDRSPERVPFKLFHPLLRCSDLADLQVDFLLPVNLEESDVRAIYKSWPKLHTLHLSAKSFSPEPTGMSLSILTTFAAYWPPALRRLALYFACDDVPSLPEDYRYPVRDLDVLAFGSAHAFDVKVGLLLAYLGSLFRVRKVVATALPWWGCESSVFEPFGEFRADDPWLQVIEAVEASRPSCKLIGK